MNTLRASVIVALVAPLALLVYLLSDPAANKDLVVPVEHLTVTTNVSMLALAVAVLVARSALEIRRYRILLTALGFMSMAGIFVVHGLFTPGVLVQGRDASAAAVVGVSAQLSLLVPAIFFAIRYTPLAAWLERVPLFQPVRLVALVAAALVAYGVAAFAAPDAFGGAMRMASTYGAGVDTYQQGYGGSTPLVAIVTLALLALAAWRQARDYLRSRLPMQGALVASFLFLAQAQVSMFLAPIWTVAWWEYHALMLVAVVVALGALFVELDRRRGLERFLPAPVVERVLVGDRLSLEGERRRVSILFADLRGSTALAERLPAEAVVALFNTYLGAMAKPVFANGGILDKFTGDGLMAVFGALRDQGDGAASAARAALAMRESIGALNRERVASGETSIGFGVGIHTGEVVLGTVGLPERSDYTAMGDAVNTASRMESLTKEFGVDAVISGETASLLNGAARVRPLGKAQVKGKAEPIEVFALA